MESVRRAVIDVGTNSVKLLVAGVRGSDVQPLLEKSRQTRLGRNFYETHRLQPVAISQTAEAVAEFAGLARKKKSQSIRVIATSAARDAVNAGELTSAIEKSSGLKVEIISGAREAEWAFQGVATESELAEMPLLILDVGGGSTEFILGCGAKKSFAHSFPLGTVRLLEKFPHSDPPARGEFLKCRRWLKNFLQIEVLPQLQPALRRAKKSSEIQLVGTGGTASILAQMENKSSRFDREHIERTVLSLKKIKTLRKNLWRLPLAGRKKIPGLPKSRADVILPGVLIYEIVMEELGFAELRVSTRGLRFAAVMD
jgi:exopolyphosphatase/guanosine-5'-triphosphate,3'-diphosphate pyrophosphatase